MLHCDVWYARTQLTPADLIYPLFVTFGENKQEPITSMPGQFRWSVDRLVPEVSEGLGFGNSCGHVVWDTGAQG